MKLFLMIFPRISLHCMLVPVQNREYETGLLTHTSRAILEELSWSVDEKKTRTTQTKQQQEKKQKNKKKSQVYKEFCYDFVKISFILKV